MTSHLRNQLMEGRAVLPRVGSVVQLETQHPAYAVSCMSSKASGFPRSPQST